MRIVQQYDLTTAAGMDKFAQEIILQRTPARMDVDLGAMNVEDAREVRKADTKHCVDFWSALPAAHGGVQGRSTIFMGAWRSALCTSLLQIRNGERSRSKSEEHLTSLLWSAPCLGRSCLVTPPWSKLIVCTHSPVLHPRSAGMLHHVLHIVLNCAW